MLKAVTAVAFVVGLLAGGAVGGHLAKSAPPATAAAPSGAKPGISLNQWMQLLRDGRLASATTIGGTEPPPELG